ncbi:MAG: hypothetical protein ACKVU4_04035 [Phycisphaerales bacterium]
MLLAHAVPVRRPRSRRRYSTDDKAIVWSLREQGLSLRAIEEQTGVPHPTIWRILHADPVRNETIETRLRARQSAEFEEMGSKAREAAILWLDECIAVGKGGLGKIKPAMLGKLAVLPRIIHATSQAAQHATKTAALLQGRATERVESTTQDLSRDPDALIDAAIECGIVGHLPPALRVEAERRVAERPGRRGTGQAAA